MAVCVYTHAYRDVAIGTILRTLGNGIAHGFHAPRTRKAFEEGKRTLENFESFGKVITTPTNLNLRAAVNYLGKKIETSDAYDRLGYRI